MHIAAMLAAAVLAAPGLANPAGLCAKWGEPEKAGTLDMATLSNASGLAASRTFPGRLYHHNDAASGPKFYLTDATGGDLKTVTVAGFTPVDLEDVAVGPCGGTGDCVVLGDFGDNGSSRTGVSFVLLREKAVFEATETPLRTVNARYPDGAHNAEGFSILPNGDLYLMTKVGRAGPTQVFRLTAAQMAVSDGSVQTFAPVASFDLAVLMGAAAGGRRIPSVTAFSFGAEGKTAVLLTYQGAVELALDFSQPLPPRAEWLEGRDFRFIATASLPQAEGIAYTADGKAILYTSEFMGGGAESPIWTQRCL